ncbi:MAG: flavodoxin family protein [Lewinella sp.]|nr:flavodoxin family protein [Lewinella sp.]
MKRIIVFGSSRGEGNTALIARYLGDKLGCPVRDLNDYPMVPYAYDNVYPENDRYLALMEELVGYHEWLLVSPVYWYAMSAQMKIFFDRISQVLRHREDLLEALHGTRMWAICVSSDSDEIPGFFEPFRLSAKYLHMDYLGYLHAWGGREQQLKPAVKLRLDSFIRRLPQLPE